MVDLRCIILRDGTDSEKKKAPKHLALVLIRTPDLAAFFPPAGVCLSCESDPSSTLYWALESQRAHDLVPALTGLLGPMVRFGGKRKPPFLWQFLIASLCPPIMSTVEARRGDAPEPCSPGFSLWERDPPTGLTASLTLI